MSTPLNKRISLSLMILTGAVIRTVPVVSGAPNPGVASPFDTVALSNTTSLSDPNCRCLPTQPCWPSDETWNAFNTILGGRLIPTTPPARECHFPSYDLIKCWKISNNYYEESWRADQPGAMMFTNWEKYKGQGCLGTTAILGQQCQQGAVPLYTVNATSIAYIQETIKFAVKHNLRLVIKNTGHDLLGRSTGPNSLSLWVHHRKKIEVFDTFVPEGAPEDTKGGPAVMIESGVQIAELVKVMDEHKRTVVVGSSPTVGVAGGFCAGGGYGILSRLYGLCVDNVLQYKVVTADGQLRVANAYQNQDLFWALRGGGPGTYGVVAEVVMRTHPPLENIIKTHVTIVSIFGSTMDKITRNFLSRHKQWAQEGWSGLAFNFYKIVQTLTIHYYLPNGDLAKVQASINDFLSYARSFLGVIVIQSSVETLPSFQEAFPTLLDLSVKRVGLNFLAGNRMIPKTMFDSEEGIDRLATALKQGKDDMYHTNSLIGAVMIFADASHVSEAIARETSVQPAWRFTLMMPTVFALWSDGISAKDEMNIKRSLTKAVGRLRAITPGFGSYINEANPDESDWQESFFGANYPRLLEIKRKYDPHGLFVCHKCVGSEDWNNDLMCRTTNTSNIMT